jgi:hypothetical protein
MCYGTPDTFNFVQWSSLALAVYAASSYFLDQPHMPSHGLSPWGNDLPIYDQSTPRPKLGSTRPLALVYLLLMVVPLAFVFLTYPLRPIPRHGDFVWNGSHLDLDPPPPHKLIPPQISSVCRRKPLPSSSAYTGPGERPDFHAFDDVLLVVFFSHARYDVNLEGYRESYSRYFPNVRALTSSSEFLVTGLLFLDSIHWPREPRGSGLPAKF